MNIKKSLEAYSIHLGFPRDWQDAREMRNVQIISLIESVVYLLSLGYVSIEWRFYYLFRDKKGIRKG